jgi:hypothetical protein
LCASEKSVLKDALLTFRSKESSETSSSLGRVDIKDGIVEGGSVLARYWLTVAPQSSDSSSKTWNHKNFEDEDMQ